MNVDPVMKRPPKLKLWVVEAPAAEMEYDCFQYGVVLAETGQDAIDIVRSTVSYELIPGNNGETIPIYYRRQHDLVATQVDMKSPRLVMSFLHYG